MARLTPCLLLFGIVLGSVGDVAGKPVTGLKFELAGWLPSVANDEPIAVFVAAIVVSDEKLIDFGLDRGLQHSLGSIEDDLIERATLVELGSKREHLGIGFGDWTVRVNFRTLTHGVLLVPSLGR